MAETSAAENREMYRSYIQRRRVIPEKTENDLFTGYDEDKKDDPEDSQDPVSESEPKALKSAITDAEELERLSRTVADMLLLAKAEHGHLLPSHEPVALGDEVCALFEFYEALADDRGVTLHVSGDATVMGDRLMLRRALSNLISNALRHTPKEGQITIRIDADAAGVRLAVSNVGDPIPADQIERIFERFHRGSAQRESRGEGAGLGLAITRSIVQAHGGHITARSAEGVTCFTITLPRNEASSPS